MAADKDLHTNQIILVWDAEAAMQKVIHVEKQHENDYKEMSQWVEEAMQQVMQAQKQHKQDLEAMQKFQQEIINQFETKLAQVKVCHFVAKVAVLASKHV